MRRHSTSSSHGSHTKDVQQKAQHPRPIFEFPTHRFSRAIFSFRFKAIKRLRHVRGYSLIRPKPQHSVVTIAKRKRSKYGHVPPPPPLATDLALMQFTGGGNIETHIKQVMEKQAKAAGGSRGTIVGIADVYRDSNGGIWWDADEEVEYAHLLDGVDRIKAEDDAEEALWEDFDESPKNWDQTHCRRSSTESTSSADSDLDPKYLFPPPEVDSYPSFTSGELNDRVLASTSRVGGEAMNALSLPSRPSRQARHLLRPVSLVDLHAFGKPKHRHSSSLSSQISSDRNTGKPRARADHKPKKAGRRRMLPLNSAHVPPSNLWNVPASAPAGAAYFEMDTTRIQFVKDSFSPSPGPSMSSTLPAGKFHRRSSSISSKSSFKKAPKKTKHPFFGIRAFFRKRNR
jgi:hypothetical protein